MTDQFASLSIRSLASGPGGYIYASIGDNSSSFATANTVLVDGGSEPGILRSADGGATWQMLAQRPFAQAPTVNPVSGDMGGALLPGKYYLEYTFVNAGGESLGSLESAQFTVAAGNVPQVNLPPLPPGATSFNIYLTPTNGASGSESILYASNVVPTSYDLRRKAPAATARPLPAGNTTVPSIAGPNPVAVPPAPYLIGGGTTGGQLAVGTYRYRYTFVGTAGETAPSAESLPFNVAVLGDVPEITLPALLPGEIEHQSVPDTDQWRRRLGGSLRLQSGHFLRSLGCDAAGAASDQQHEAVRASPLNAANIPTVDPKGGGLGGELPVGNYLLEYTWSNAGGETVASSPVAFSVITAGDVPRVTLGLGSRARWRDRQHLPERCRRRRWFRGALRPRRRPHDLFRPQAHPVGGITATTPEHFGVEWPGPGAGSVPGRA